MAGATRLELATFGVTGRCCNQLNYAPVKETIYFFMGFFVKGGWEKRGKWP